MRRLDSLRTLIEKWSTEKAPQDFIYTDFQFTVNEFDNVPSILPKFLLHLQ